jgi:hypothetical protein
MGRSGRVRVAAQAHFREQYPTTMTLLQTRPPDGDRVISLRARLVTNVSSAADALPSPRHSCDGE